MSTLAQTSAVVNPSDVSLVGWGSHTPTEPPVNPPAFDFSRQRVPVFGRTVLTLAAGDKVLWERSNARNMRGGYRMIKATVVSAKPGAASVKVAVKWANGLGETETRQHSVEIRKLYRFDWVEAS